MAGVDPAAFEKCHELAALCSTGIQRPGDVPGAPQGIKRRAAAGTLSGHPAGPVRNSSGTTGQGRLRRQALGLSWKNRSARDLASARRAQPHSARCFRREDNLPHRPLPREEAGAQHVVLPFRQCAARTVWNRQHMESVQITMAEDSASRAAARFTTRPAPSAT